MMNQTQKEFLLHGYDFEYLQLSKNNHIFYDTEKYLILRNLNIKILDYTSLYFEYFNEGLHLLGLGIKDLATIAERFSKLKSISRVSFYDNLIVDINPLILLKNLKYLSITLNPVEDIQILSQFSNLKKLGLAYCKVRDFSPLYNLKNLKEIDLGYVNNDMRSEYQILKKHLPNCYMTHT